MGDIVQNVDAPRGNARQALLSLIDGSSQRYRAFPSAVRTADGGILRNAAGQAHQRVYIFMTMLRK